MEPDCKTRSFHLASASLPMRAWTYQTNSQMEAAPPTAPPLPYHPTSQEIAREKERGRAGLRSLHSLLAGLPRSRVLAREERRQAFAEVEGAAGGPSSLGLPDRSFLQPSSALEFSAEKKAEPAPASTMRLDALLGEKEVRVHLVCLGRAPASPSRAGRRPPTATPRVAAKEDTARVSRGRDVNARYRLRGKEGIVWADVMPRTTKRAPASV